MHLPSRLRSTTLGDLLGALHRARASGTVELVEDRGRVHRIHLTEGLIDAADLDGPGPSLAEILRHERSVDDDLLRRSLLRALSSHRLHGEVLAHEFRVSPAIVGRALRRQIVARLAAMEEVVDARVAFRVAVRPPRWALQGAPLEPREFLHGRCRARERGMGPRRSRRGEVADLPSPPPPDGVADASAWRVLGVSPTAEVAEIKRAYRRLARSVHPDLHPGVTDDQRRALEARFMQITEAYKALVA
jgi:DnaJ-domain-containing protein 1